MCSAEKLALCLGRLNGDVRNPIYPFGGIHDGFRVDPKKFNNIILQQFVIEKE